MTNDPKLSELTKRERQIMDVVYRLDKASAAEIVEHLPGEHKNATIRTLLSVMEVGGGGGGGGGGFTVCVVDPPPPPPPQAARKARQNRGSVVPSLRAFIIHLYLFCFL